MRNKVGCSFQSLVRNQSNSMIRFKTSSCPTLNFHFIFQHQNGICIQDSINTSSILAQFLILPYEYLTFQKVAALEKSFQYKLQALLYVPFFWLYHMGKRVTSIFCFFQYIHIQDMNVLANQCDGHCVIFAQLADIYCIPSQNIAFFLLFE